MKRSLAHPSERLIRVALLALALAVRLPLIPKFNFVTFDGTYYLTQARNLLHGSFSGGDFPIGYPMLVAPLIAIIRDSVVAGMLVSLLASLGSTLVFYELGKCYAGRSTAALGAAVLTTTPLFIQTSLHTLAGSAYTFWILLGLWLYGRGRMRGAGLSLGMATITRPEAVAIAGALTVIHVVRRRTLVFPLAILAVYAVNVAAMSINRGELRLMSRSGDWQAIATPWVLRESSIEYEGKEAVEARLREEAGEFSRTREYFRRIPKLAGTLGRHLLPVLPLLALFGVVRRPNIVLVALLPLAIIPLFSLERGQARWLMPYLPPLILFGLVGMDRIAHPGARRVAAVAVVLCALASLAVNRDALTGGVEHQFAGARAAGRKLAVTIAPGDRIADRKPYVAFYAGAEYVEIPVSPYDETVAHLARENVRYLSLHVQSVHALRPALRPLLYDRSAVRGELRYRQVDFQESGEIIYERALAEDPLRWRRLTTPAVADLCPAWSPDGSAIAFRRYQEDGSGAVMLVDAAGGNERVLAKTGRLKDPLAWSPDGSRLAFAAKSGDHLGLVVCDLRSGRVTPLTDAAAHDWNPSWCRATGEIVFCSEREGSPALFRLPSPGGRVARLSSLAPADLVSISPSGARVTWSDAEGRLVVMEAATGSTVVVREPRELLSPATWSPDEQQVMVEVFDWGAANVYLIDVGSGRALALTRALSGAGMPAWSPRGGEVVVVSAQEDVPALWMLSDIDPYRARLVESDDVGTFQRPDDTRVPAPPGARRLRAAARQ